MKKIFLLITMASLSIFLLDSCDDKKDNGKDSTQTLLVEARMLFANGEYGKALQTVDSIYRVTPITLHEITTAELLGDSIIKIVNQNKIDSLNETINQYKIEMYKEKNIKNKNIWIQKIDSVEKLKISPRTIINNINTKEGKRLVQNQCKTIMRYR